jgi:hypothetical protein
MSRWSYFLDVVHLVPASELLAVAIVWFMAQATYNLKFHPLAKYPGPKIAAISNIWWAFHRLSLSLAVYLSAHQLKPSAASAAGTHG